MTEAVKIIECPRDAWQGLSAVIPAEVKAGYLRSLIGAGFTHIDAVSFVSPKAVPQMADSERVLELLQPLAEVEIIGIAVNLKGAERAIATGAVKTIGFPYSISEEFLRRNQNQTRQQSLHVLEEIVALATVALLDVVVYVSMAFGNPYHEPWSEIAVLDAVQQIADVGVRAVSLADTVGAGTAAQISHTVCAVAGENEGVEMGVHLHARRDRAPALIRAAYEAGCRRFDSALGGLGGCPFAQDELVGNIPTEILLATLKACGANLPAIANLGGLIHASGEIAAGHRAAVPGE